MRSTNEEKEASYLRTRIRSAFPDERFDGPITAVDGQPNEELDEEGALYAALHGKRWSDISISVVESNPDGFVLLTDEAHAAFLPAWLMCALQNARVREMVVYAFLPRESADRMRQRIRHLTSAQSEVLVAFLAFVAEIESSNVIKEAARGALTYVTTVVGF